MAVIEKKVVFYNLILSEEEMKDLREALQNSPTLGEEILDALKEETDVRKRVEMTPAPMC